MGLLRTLLYIILIYYILKILGRIFMPFIVKKGMEQMEKRQRNYDNGAPPEKEGEIIIEKKPQETPKEKTDGGEYIDYEEIE